MNSPHAFSHRRRVLAAALSIVALGSISAVHAGGGKQVSPAHSSVDDANPLVGTAPLDRKEFIGNAPPPGEPLYSGMTSPGASLPQSSTDAAPVNINADLSFATGVPVSYAYGRPAMIGFTGGGSTDGARAAPMIMPVVGDWTVPPDYAPSYYDKSTEKASPGYYAVDLATFHTRAELT